MRLFKLILLPCIIGMNALALADPVIAAPVIAELAEASLPITTAEKNEPVLAPPSSTAQKLYLSAKSDLLQIRVLLKNGHSQSSVGSGFMIGTSNLVITNYHVVSQIALEPETYQGEYIDTNGKRGDIELLNIDVLHDLAVVRVNRSGTGFFKIPAQLSPLSQGQYLYSLGNPLDLGFAISEGTYNGIIKRGFSDQFMFTGAINAGMSGGPNITNNGNIAGVNVSRRMDGELVSFLVPARFVQKILKKVEQQKKPPNDFNQLISEQLLKHQQLMTDKILATPLTVKTLGPYLAPVRESDQFRCWGNSNKKSAKTYSKDRIRCSMESQIYISDSLKTAYVTIDHTFTQSKTLDQLRFSHLIGKSFSNLIANDNSDDVTNGKCHEAFITSNGLPMRLVFCVSAYKKLPGLYDFALLGTSTDNKLKNLSSTLYLAGFSYDNGLRITRTFIESYRKGSAQ